MYTPNDDQPTEHLRPQSPAPVPPQAPVSSQQPTEVIAGAGAQPVAPAGGDAPATQVLGVAPQFTAHTGTEAGSRGAGRRVAGLIAGGVLLLTVVVVAALLLLGGGGSQQASSEVAAATTASGAAAAADPSVDGSASDAGADQGTTAPGGSTATTPSGKSTTGGSSASTKPVITSASLPSTYDCKKSTTFQVSWKTQNVTKVDVSVDGGLYGTYGPNDSVGIPANCNDTQAVKITAYGKDGSKVSKSVTAKDVSKSTDPKSSNDGGGSKSTGSTASTPEP